MKRLLIAISVLSFSSPLLSVEPEIRYFLSEDSLTYGPVQYLDYETLSNRYYIRTETRGRYIAPEELNRLIRPDFVTRLQQNDRFDAVLESLIFFDRSAQYRHYTDPSRAYQLNWRSRWWKIGSLLVTAFAYVNMQGATGELNSKIRYLNHDVAERRFNRARSYYWTALSGTVLLWGYEGYRAYSDYGTAEGVGDLEFSRRIEVDPNQFFPSQPSGNSLSVRWSFEI